MNGLERALIVNADDFGQSDGVNEGTVIAHERGIVTSASLMVRFPAALAAARYAAAHPELSVGLHIDLGEWAFRNGDWVPLYEVVAIDDASAVAVEINAQLEAFGRILGRPPTHLDSHQHVHRREPVRSILAAAAERLGIPLRSESGGVRYCGAFYGQLEDGTPYPEAITREALIEIIRSLEPGCTEVGCHPALGDDLDTMYRLERAVEVAVLCDPEVRAAVDDAGVSLAAHRQP